MQFLLALIAIGIKVWWILGFKRFIALAISPIQNIIYEDYALVDVGIHDTAFLIASQGERNTYFNKRDRDVLNN